MAERYRIVVADDEAVIRDGLIHLFPWENLGFTVAADFSNGLEIMEYLKSHDDVHVVLTDIRMPVMDGIEVAEAMKSRNIKVIFFSSYEDFAYARSAIKHNVFDYLLKPVKYQELVECFERLKKVLDREYGPKEIPREAVLEIKQNPIPKVLAYIEEHISDCSLEEASRTVYLSPKYLSVLFKENQGISFSDYVQNKKMKRACELLKDPAIRQYQIASLIGYENPKNFSRAFKSYYGITPQEYRKQHLNHEGEEEQIL